MEMPTGHFGNEIGVLGMHGSRPHQVYVLALRSRTKSTSCQELKEKGTKVHFPAIDAEVAVLTRGQAVSTGVKVEGPFKGGHCRCYMTWDSAVVGGAAGGTEL